MSEISIQATFRTRQPLLPIEIEQAFLEELKQSFSKISVTEKQGTRRIAGRIIPRIFNSVVSFTGAIAAETRGEKGRVQFTGQTHTNGMFWITLLILLLFAFPLAILVPLMYWQQNGKAISAFEKAKERLEFRLNDW